MKPMKNEDLTLVATTLRCMAADMIQKAKSGHPGVAMGLADVATVLWLKFLKVWGGAPKWMDRDRVVFSGGHASALLYSLLHFSDFGLSIDDLKNFRQLGSQTPGHPEFGQTDGVETTTGPLGQGLANAVGMAIAERMMAARFNTEERTMVDHRTWVFCGDGDLMEGISHEACSYAGHLGLDKLVAFYDDNTISIEGRTSLTMSDDAALRFKAYGWAVLKCDGHDFEAIEKTIKKALRVKGQPVLIICRTTIGKGAPNKQDSAASHGAPLGDDEVRLTKQALGFNPDEFFAAPAKVYTLFAERQATMKRFYNKWNRMYKAFIKEGSELCTLWKQMVGDMQGAVAASLPSFDVEKPVSTRVASGKILNALAPVVPQLVGGSADLAPSNMTYLNGLGDIGRGAFAGRNFHFGVREIGMSAVMNGVGIHGGFRIFGGTFFVFCDYCRPVMRVAALMKLPVIYVFTHDSFYVGEDGPTHEPVEQLAALRAMPGLSVIRPADATETAAAWQVALAKKDAPTCLILSRQNLPVIDRSQYPAASELSRGAYTLWQNHPELPPELIIIASGSEVSISLEAAKQFGHRNVRVVSMPSWDLFDAQPQAYKDEVLPPDCKKRLAVEAGVSMGWERYIGSEGATMCMKRFGASGPCNALAQFFGFTAAEVLMAARTLMIK